MQYDRLSALDATFLHLERLGSPMHVGALAVFEGGPFFTADGEFRLADARALVAARLDRIPRFRKRVQPVPLDADHPVWVDDEDFDVARHVRGATLPRPGDRGQLLALFERLQARRLDRRHPLWELWFVTGLEGGEVALIQKTHHALADGIASVDVATALLDLSPDVEWTTPRRWSPRPAPTPGRLLIDSVRDRLTGIVDPGASAQPATAPDPLARAARLARSVATFADDGVTAPRTSLNRPVGPSRRFACVRRSLDEVATVRRALGGTLNDVVLAGVAGGLGRLLEARGELTPGLALKAFCPVSVRDPEDAPELGNRVSGMLVPLPVAERDPVVRLATVRATTARLKASEQAAGASAVLGLTDYVAPTLFSAAVRLVAQQRLINLVCTNVPGPSVPLYCLGARMLEAYPMVPLAANLSLGVAILSYCGHLHIGLLADRDQWDDLDTLESGLDDAFAELHKAASER